MYHHKYEIAIRSSLLSRQRIAKRSSTQNVHIYLMADTKKCWQDEYDVPLITINIFPANMFVYLHDKADVKLLSAWSFLNFSP